MPRSGFGPNARPCTATYAMSGFVGCTRTREICCVSASPRNVHVLPPSAVFQTPSPWETLPRIAYSPVPTYTTSGFDSLTPIAPIVPPKYLSVTGSQVSPPSVVLKTPPPVVPIQYSLGRDAEPATATLRPPRKMPISRQVSAAKTVESYAWAGAGRGGTTTGTTTASTARSADERTDTGFDLLTMGERRSHPRSTERPNAARAGGYAPKQRLRVSAASPAATSPAASR